jgi:pullulanase/glycogen debranching enzyme
MSLNNFRVKLLSLAVSSAVLAFAPNLAFAKNYESEMVIIHPFQWSYDSIAKECTEYLGPAGFDGVQISQPAEHANKGNVWWAVYQPVNFNNFTTMTGNETQLKNMIKACNEAGVKVFADAVFNQRPNDGVGLGGSTYGNNSYPDGFNDGDFHHNGCSVSNYSDEWNVRQCALLGMTDTATDNSSTQDKIADFLVKLMGMGVYGFRIDAAKHMHYNDINAIMEKTEAKAGKRPPIYMEVIGNSKEAPDIQPNKYTFIDNSVVTDFSYVDRMKEIFDNGDYGSALTFGLAVDSDNAEVFVNNHDDEYHRCSAGSCSMGTQGNPKYNLAQSWLAVWPKGKVRQIYSGYKFNSHDPAGPISADRCQGGWLCQHRVPFVLNAPRFARATRGEAVSTSGFSDNVLWFNRGSKGFYAMNTSGGEVTKSFNVTMADGTYCDILGATDPKNNPCGSDITVSGGKITVTIPSMSAIAICTDSQWCGKGVDPCETDPNGAACLCKGSQTTDGICVSYCQKYPETEGCYCLTNPTDSSCVSIPATKNNLCYAGTSNSWKFDPMTYSKSTGYWTVDVTLTGADKQRFKVAEGCAWTGNVYGASGTPGKLAINTSTDGDEYTTLTGDYTLKIKDADMTYEFVKAGPSNHDPVAGFTTQINGLTVTFTNTSKDEDGDTLTYSWNFGNGKTSTDKNPSVIYDEKGTYHVTLTVTDPSKASNTAEDDVTVGGGETTGYAKTAIRTSHDNYGTHELIKKSASSSEWTGEFNFTEATSFKIEALPNSKDQCIFLGGKAGEALKASGDFISVEAGEYTITFNESTKVLTVTKKETVVDDKKANCDKDGSTNNCETSSLAYTFLGASYTPTATTFRLWSPDSSNVSVTVNGQTYTMSKTNVSGYSDVYEAVVEGDLDGKEYQFKVNGSDVHAPYGKMVKPTNYTGTGAVAENNVNIVMNMRDTDLPNGWAERPALKEREDSIVYEVHVRDFTIDSSSGVSAANRGRYLGMVEAGTTNSKGLKTGLDHLKDLGITHVQLLPVYDYGTCSNVDSQDSSCYNWGYDPVNFNVPEDRYTSVFGTENYKQKVKEFKTMVDEFHKNGIRVIMDVVYNHTYSKDVFSKISGKYYTSVDLSGCGNSVDAKNDMVSRFIRDSLEYWATEYNIDGFRFDLVGIFDVSDFKEWGEYLNNKYPDRKFLMYGEPWNGYATDPSESTRVRLGTIRNAASGHVGVFNGKYRECLKGGSDNAVGGFLFNKTYSDVGDVDGNFGCVMAGIKGGVGDSTNTWTPLFAADPEQAVQYITAHDNLNWTDKITKMGATGDYAKRLQAYGNGVILVSQGIPFIHAGEEFGRTKNMNENSYKSADGSNDIKWDVITS